MIKTKHILYNMDVKQGLSNIPDKHVDTCITSPPYYQLRDYKVPPSQWPEVSFIPMPGLPEIKIPAMECQLGLEPDIWSFIGHMVYIMRDVHRVLKDEGTVWLNFGDTYAGSGNGAGDKGYNFNRSREKYGAVTRTDYWKPGPGLKRKDLMGIPWRVAFALQADGWWLRQDIIWHKENPMPENVKDRCTKAHEYIFLLSKSRKYYFDQSAILQPASENTHSRVSQDLANQIGSHRANGGSKTNGPMKAVTRRKLAKSGSGIKSNESFNGAMSLSPEMVNKRSVWSVATESFREAHFATFPQALISDCIKAGSPEGGVVLDPFSGALTTLLVSDKLNRNGIGIEIKEEYCDIGNKRMQRDSGMFCNLQVIKNSML